MKSEKRFNWQQDGWPKFTFDRAALGAELRAFTTAFKALKKELKKPQDLEVIARALTDEAVKTSAIEGIAVDESVVMSSICKALGVASAPKGFTKDARAEGVAQMMLTVREKWNSPISSQLLLGSHEALMNGEEKRIAVGAFRSRREPMRVIRQHADGTVEIRYEAPPSEYVPKEIATFVKMWNTPTEKPADIALKAVMIHPHFESIHPFEDGNGRVGRALVAKVIAEGLGLPLILPISTIIARHRVAYYDEINEASRSLDWTNWAAFFIPVLTEMLTSFLSAARFVKAKRDYLAKYESRMSDRSRKVVLRMFEDGEEGAKGVLSAAKWMRMTKVSKPTAIADLMELEKVGAVVRIGIGQRLDYRLSDFTVEPLNEALKNVNAAKNKGEMNVSHEPQFDDDGINEGINAWLIRLIATHPGSRLPYLKSVIGKSAATVERAIAVLVKAGKVEHRGSKKTGGYWVVT